MHYLRTVSGIANERACKHSVPMKPPLCGVFQDVSWSLYVEGSSTLVIGHVSLSHSVTPGPRGRGQGGRTWKQMAQADPGKVRGTWGPPGATQLTLQGPTNCYTRGHREPGP